MPAPPSLPHLLVPLLLPSLLLTPSPTHAQPAPSSSLSLPRAGLSIPRPTDNSIWLVERGFVADRLVRTSPAPRITLEVRRLATPFRCAGNLSGPEHRRIHQYLVATAPRYLPPGYDPTAFELPLETRAASSTNVCADIKGGVMEVNVSFYGVDRTEVGAVRDMLARLLAAARGMPALEPVTRVRFDKIGVSAVIPTGGATWLTGFTDPKADMVETLWPHDGRFARIKLDRDARRCAQVGLPKKTARDVRTSGAAAWLPAAWSPMYYEGRTVILGHDLGWNVAACLDDPRGGAIFAFIDGPKERPATASADARMLSDLLGAVSAALGATRSSAPPMGVTPRYQWTTDAASEPEGSDQPSALE